MASWLRQKFKQHKTEQMLDRGRQHRKEIAEKYGFTDTKPKQKISAEHKMSQVKHRFQRSTPQAGPSTSEFKKTDYSTPHATPSRVSLKQIDTQELDKMAAEIDSLLGLDTHENRNAGPNNRPTQKPKQDIQRGDILFRPNEPVDRDALREKLNRIDPKFDNVELRFKKGEGLVLKKSGRTLGFGRDERVQKERTGAANFLTMIKLPEASSLRHELVLKQTGIAQSRGFEHAMRLNAYRNNNWTADFSTKDLERLEQEVAGFEAAAQAGFQDEGLTVGSLRKHVSNIDEFQAKTNNWGNVDDWKLSPVKQAEIEEDFEEVTDYGRAYPPKTAQGRNPFIQDTGSSSNTNTGTGFHTGPGTGAWDD
ncbi:hypothetical protein JM93_01654 [Roseibium hamelinense]|uniref:Uncharacterized protein n=1 Tax=Roseibium hamelinense TaxID=150831 RepID=A0A562T797_9HYPH|nr:hypothetical protein [Roseibium hamelinense]MTI43765.1 hypothetical protein [Roseibium hamelinense]TWI89451.1 hypothetical protein JM93_01654 [Roseibium hamelinense]